MKNDGTHTATFYVQIRAKRSHWNPDQIERLGAVRVSQTKPDEVLPGCVVIKLNVRIPDAAFEPFQPEAVIDIPAELVQRPIEVEAGDPA